MNFSSLLRCENAIIKRFFLPNNISLELGYYYILNVRIVSSWNSYLFHLPKIWCFKCIFVFKMFFSYKQNILPSFLATSFAQSTNKKLVLYPVFIEYKIFVLLFFGRNHSNIFFKSRALPDYNYAYIIFQLTCEFLRALLKYSNPILKKSNFFNLFLHFIFI